MTGNVSLNIDQFPAFSPAGGVTINISGMSSNFHWYNIVSDFGAVGDGVTDNSTAFLNFQTTAKAQTTPGVVLVIPPGKYLNPSAGAFWTGIPNLTILGYGAYVGTFSRGGPFLQNSFGTTAAFIVSNNVGDTQVTCITPAQAGIFAVGNWVAIGSDELQTSGYPPNLYNVEYRQVTSVNASTGVVGLDQPLRFANLSTLPLVPGEIWNGGPAAIYLLDQSWAQQVSIYGLTMDQLAAGQLVQISAQYFHAYDSTFLGNAGSSPSQSQDCLFDHCSFTAMELDKCITSVKFNKCTFTGNYICFSSSNDRIVHDGCEFWTQMVGTPGRFNEIKNSYLNQLFIGSSFGAGGPIVLDSNRINQVSIVSTTEVIDSSDLTYANGVFSILKTSSTVGQMYAFALGSMNLISFVGDIVAYPFTITAITDDGTSLHFQTDLQLAALPTITGLGIQASSIIMHRCPRLSARNNTGCDEAVNMSKAPSDWPWQSYSHRFLTGTIGAGAVTPTRILGTPIKINANVIRPYTGAQPALNLFLEGQFGPFYFSPSTLVGARWQNGSSVGAYIDCTKVGARTYNVGAGTFANVQGTDNLPTLPTDVWLNFVAFPFFGDNNGNNVSVAGDAQYKWPLVELEITLDQIVGKSANLWVNTTLTTA